MTTKVSDFKIIKTIVDFTFSENTNTYINLKTIFMFVYQNNRTNNALHCSNIARVLSSYK